MDLGSLAREGGAMARKRYAAEEIIGYLRTLEIEMGKGLAVLRQSASASRRSVFTHGDLATVPARLRTAGIVR